ncbi:MAG: agmatine deiminase family protein [Planctomycetota bacterium]|jgi:agmatine/peptidylarginine deiminase
MPSLPSHTARFGLILILGTATALPAWAQPAAPVRVCAEWEPAVGTLISWPLGIPQGLVVELAEDDMLFVLVTGPGAESQARATFTGWGIDPAHVEFIHTSVQSHWPRDWGPHQIFDGSGQWAIVDPIFEGYPWVPVECQRLESPGGHAGDDAVNIDVAAHFGAPLHALPAYLTGGNFHVDGHAAAFSSCAMVNENEQLWTEPQFLGLAEQYVGIADYHIVDNTENFGIQHIDCWLMVLDEETLLVKRPPTGHEEYDRIEANLQVLDSATTCYGRPYRVIRIDCPPFDGYNVAAYTNAFILNEKVLVPTFGIPGDVQALQTFADAMPGYEVIGFPGAWYHYDALHCRVRAIFDRHMLRMTHRRLDEQVDPAPDYEITVFIDDRSEAGLMPDELRVYHRQHGETVWNWLLLTPTGEPDTYGAALPGPALGATIEYYVAAADFSGRAETLPRTAPAGFYSFTVIDPGLTITVADPPVMIAPGTPTTFEVTIDPGNEQIVPGTELLHHRYDGGEFLATPLTPLGGDQYQATLPAALCADSPEFYISAEGTSSGLKTAPAGAPGDVFAAEVGALVTVTVFEQRFESGLPPDWTTSGLWHVTGACAVTPPCDGLAWTYYGRDDTCNYDTGSRTSGALATPAIALPVIPPGGDVTLSYCSTCQTENEPGYDVAGLYVNGQLLDTPSESSNWGMRLVDLTAFAGQTVGLEWRFDSIDEFYNDFPGWQVDAVTITASDLECENPCPADVNDDGIVNVEDFLLLLGAWGSAGGPADVNGDGIVNVEDFLLLLGAWGDCP